MTVQPSICLSGKYFKKFKALGCNPKAAGFNNWYGAWNNAETMYKTAGVTILPITLTGTSMPLIINKNR
jgi:hypothetical protein